AWSLYRRYLHSFPTRRSSDLREFPGQRLTLVRPATPFGDLVVELYLSPDGLGACRGVAVCKDGTRVLRDITELEQFQHSPWTDADRKSTRLNSSHLGISYAVF